MFAWGDLIRVDLTKGQVTVKELSKDLRLGYVGGRGVNSKILYDEVKPGIDAYDPGNRLIYGSGPVGGTLSPSSGRWTMSAKSPLTGLLGDGNAGGHWAAELKLAGHQHIVVQGKSRVPVYLNIKDDDVEILDAEHLWGMDTWEAQKTIIDDSGDPRTQTIAIGPAGENLVRYACAVHGVTRSPGRMGTGAVMGSKKLKAIAVRGTKGVKVANPKEFEKVVEEMVDIIHNGPLYWRHERWGTTSLLRKMAEQGRFNQRNYQSGLTMKEAEGLDVEEYDKYTYSRKACFRCEIGCRHMTRVENGPFACLGEGTELTIILTFGTLVGNFSLPAVLKISELCNLYGLDFASTGAVIAFLMELYQRGIIDEEDTEGIRLEWGNMGEAMRLVKNIAYRKGFGNIAAEGSLKAAQKIGNGAEKYAMHIKGAEMLGTLCRAYVGSALAYSTSTRGGDHLRGVPTAEIYDHNPEYVKKIFGDTSVMDRSSYDRKDELVIWQEHFNTIQDMLPICRFACSWQLSNGIYPKHLARLLSAATGVDFNVKTLFRCAERVWNIEAAFNAREGWNRGMDVPPGRSYEPIKSGPAKGIHVDPKKFEELKDRYYKRRGWNTSTGIPTREKLKELGLEYVANEIDKVKAEKGS